MLDNGAHVRIGGVDYMIAEGEGNYVHEYQPLFSNSQNIVGGDEKESNRPDLIYWSFDDFSGGEGFKYFNPQDPITYWKGECNPREIGALTAPPTQTAATGLPTLSSSTTCSTYFTRAHGRLYMAKNRQVAYSTDDGLTWSEHTSSPLGAAGDIITGITSDDYYVYVTFHTAPTTTGTRKVDRLTSAGRATFVSNKTSVLPFRDLVVLEGNLYGWTGRNLNKYALNSSLPITHSDATHMVYDPWDENAPSSGFVAKTVHADQSIFFMNSSDGRTKVYEWRKDTPTPIWELPEGFDCVDMCVSNGALYLLGKYGTDRSGLFAMSIASRSPIYVSDITPPSGNSVPRKISPGPGYQVLITDDVDGSSPRAYVYDAQQDAISMLKEITSFGGVGTPSAQGKYRLVSGQSSTTWKLMAYSPDTSPSGAWNWYSGAWDQGYPWSAKTLLGIHVVVDPLPASGTVQVYYQDDEDGAWTSAGTVSGTGTKNAYLEISNSSSTVQARVYRFRMDGAAGAKVLSMTPVFQIADYTEAWTVNLRIKDEQNARNARPKNRAKTGYKLRENLKTLASNKSVVAFLNGYESKDPGVYSTYTVTLEYPQDMITSPGEGTARVVLRKTT